VQLRSGHFRFYLSNSESAVDTPPSAADIINRDLEQIHQWSVNWLVKFNPQKTETMVISRKLMKPLHPPLEMNSQIIQQGTNHKHLGLFFSNNGLWHDHIDSALHTFRNNT
jgi:hypothetical protein